MMEFINNNSQYSPLLILVIVIFLVYKHHNNRSKNSRTIKSLLIGTSLVGAIFFVLGFLVGVEIYCIGAKYAECTLGGLFVGGPLSFTLAAGVYLYFWSKKNFAP